METVRVKTSEAVSGMVVAADIYTFNDQLAVTRETILNERMITKLRFYHVLSFLVYKGILKEEVPEEVSYIEELRNTVEFKKFNSNYVEIVGNVEESFNEVLQGEGEFDIDLLMQETNRILQEGRNGIHVFEMLQGIRDYDDITYVHSLNVALICNVFGGWLKMSEEDTKLLTVAGLLHDIGKMLVPKEIIQKAERLTEDEFEVIKTHSLKGYQALKDYPIDIQIKYGALMHHERCDGSGYPNGFKADQINEFAKIIAIVDVYDAMTSNRKYRNAICPFDVVENFERDGFLKFDPKYLMVFLERIIQSYIHNRVRLSDNRVGEVVMINKTALSRPVIRVGKEFIDLSKNRNINIEAII